MNDEEPLTISCGKHGTRISAVVCGHMLQQTDRVLGFVENRSDPNDLQAWCDDCERMFLQEEDMTEDFRKFNSMALVFTVCYAMLKERHTKPETRT